jgi:DUF1680 family protein
MTMLVPVLPATGRSRPVPGDAVRLDHGFWAQRQSLNQRVMLDHCDTWVTRMGWLDSFAAAARGEPDTRQGKLFTDADVYKLIEAFAWETGRVPDPARERRIRELGRLVAAAQEEDGYLNTYFGPRRERYVDLAHGHELYCAGHLFQAAVARLRTHGEDELTEAARRLADRICADFGPAGRDGVDGHPEVETGLVELYRATGEARYREQARRVIELRGHRTLPPHPIGHEYYLDDQPVREARVLRGHVVRAQYLAAAAVDVAVETGDRELLDAVVAQWDATWARRTYLTGGMGARHLGESYGDDFELPPDRAYTETCGAVAAVMTAWRLLLATGEVRFADAIERLLFNLVATSPSVAGDRFFYVNPLLRRQPGIEVADGVAPFRKDTLRANWFWVSCCPTNLVRLLASLSAYIASTTPDGLYLHQLAAGAVEATMDDGRRARLRVDTDYPWAGWVRVRVEESAGEWALHLRVPGWAGSGATVSAGGVRRPVEPGYASVRRDWRPGDEVVLELPMASRFVRADPRVNALRGTVAVERGPLVYCLELFDERDGGIDELTINPAEPPGEEPADGPGDVTVRLAATGVRHRLPATGLWPYRPEIAAEDGTPAELPLIPYFAWANRGPSTMRVWIPSY